MADVDIKIEIQAAKAEATLARLNSSLKITAEREKQAALRTQILTQKLNNAATAGTNASKGFSVASISLASFIGNITSRAVSSGITGIINGFKSVVIAGREFEDGLVGIGKTTGVSGKELTNLGKSIQNIGKEIPTSTKNLLEIAQVAGQLGIRGSNNITQFTETMAKLQLATDIAGQEGSQSVARILDITGELQKNGTDNIKKFGSVITQLGNNFAATESQILTVATEVAKGTAAFGVASEDILGLATAFKATGSEAEVSGSAIQRVFTEIGQATQDGGDKLTKFAEAAGVTNEEFAKIFKADPTKAFLQLAKGLRDSSDGGAELTDKLVGLGLGSVRVTKSLVPLIARYDTLSSSISTARQEAESKTALDRETAAAQETLTADLTKLSNAYDRMASSIFDRIGPALRFLVQNTTAFIDNLNELAPSMRTIEGLFGSTGLFLGLLNDAYKLVNPQMSQHDKNLESLKEGYEQLDEPAQDYLDTLNSTIGGLQRINGPMGEYEKQIAGVNTNLVELAQNQASIVAATEASTKKITVFEGEKLQALKKFFKAEEQAKLESNFAIIKSDKEREEFSKFVTSEGERRRLESFKRTLGLDKASLEAERQRQAELKTLRSAEDDYLQELLDKKIQREETLRQTRAQAAIAESAALMLATEEKIAFEDAEIGRLAANLDRETQARIAAKEQAIQTEAEKNQFIAELRIKAADQEIQQRERANRATVNLERQKQNLTLDFARAGATALFQIAGANNSALFALNKAFAISDVIIKGIQAEALAVSQLGIFAPPAVAGIRLNTGLQVATIVAQAIGQASSGSFEQGGIVGGNSNTGDNLIAKVNSSEMILNRSQQNQLFRMANGGQGQGGQQEIVVNTNVQIDGETIATAVSRQVANGLQLGEVQ